MHERLDIDFGDSGLAPPETAAPGPMMLIAMPYEVLLPRFEPGPLGRGLRGLMGRFRTRFRRPGGRRRFL